VPDFRALLAHSGILHARLVVRRTERSRFVEQHHRNHMLQTYVRHFAIVDQSPLGRRNLDNHLLHLIRVERMTLLQIHERVQRRLNGRSDNPFLEIPTYNLVPLARCAPAYRRKRRLPAHSDDNFDSARDELLLIFR